MDNKRALIISDNHRIVNEFCEIVLKKNIQNWDFSFAISPNSKKEDFHFIKRDEFYTFDLKKKKHIDFITREFDTVISLHCKQIFPPKLFKKVKCINVHPGYNPYNRGWYPQVFSIINNLPIGVTIHEIDEDIDHGNIIFREKVEKYSYDTSETLYDRIVKKEIELIDLHLVNILANNYATITPENEGNLYLKNDFNNLLELNLEEVSTVGKVIDKLRALTHGDYNNAYFIDKNTKKKIFISITLQRENFD